MKQSESCPSNATRNPQKKHFPTIYVYLSSKLFACMKLEEMLFLTSKSTLIYKPGNILCYPQFSFWALLKMSCTYLLPEEYINKGSKKLKKKIRIQVNKNSKKAFVSKVSDSNHLSLNMPTVPELCIAKMVRMLTSKTRFPVNATCPFSTSERRDLTKSSEPSHSFNPPKPQNKKEIEK